MTITAGTRVLHRLALGVEVIDGRTGRLAQVPVRVGREVPMELSVPDIRRLAWPCTDLEYSGPGRFRQRQVPSLPSRVVLRAGDLARQFVPRRFELLLWPLADLEAADQTPPAGPFVPVASRLLRSWLLPAPSSAFAPGTTGVRGRITRGGVPVRWPRVTAFGPGGVPVGWAHGDDRGEFLLEVTGTGLLPPPVDSTIAIDLEISARPAAQTPAPDPADWCGDLPVEWVPRAAIPPAPFSLDNPQLRGRARPPGYVASAGGRVPLTVETGTVLAVQQDLPFTD
ncbi:hypothetical protein [Longispora albida]|uniref:hypothetical protein n=1 Tax=Longispora albida TaxID=203523 RepID=UPI0003619B68|nr:hypothetical protein [Longispora albida]